MANRHFRRIAASKAAPAAEVTREELAGEPRAKPAKLPSFAPYSVGVFFEGKDGGRDNFGTGAEAIAYAGLALGDSKVLGVEIYDRQNSLVATGNHSDGIRILRLLDCEPGNPPAFKVEKVPEPAPYFFAVGSPERLEKVELVAGEKRLEVVASELATELDKRRPRLNELVSKAILAKIFLREELEAFRKLDKDRPGLSANAGEILEGLTTAIDAIVRAG